MLVASRHQGKSQGKTTPAVGGAAEIFIPVDEEYKQSKAHFWDFVIQIGLGTLTVIFLVLFVFYAQQNADAHQEIEHLKSHTPNAPASPPGSGLDGVIVLIEPPSHPHPSSPSMDAPHSPPPPPTSPTPPNPLGANGLRLLLNWGGNTLSGADPNSDLLFNNELLMNGVIPTTQGGVTFVAPPPSPPPLSPGLATTGGGGLFGRRLQTPSGSTGASSGEVSIQTDTTSQCLLVTQLASCSAGSSPTESRILFSNQGLGEEGKSWLDGMSANEDLIQLYIQAYANSQNLQGSQYSLSTNEQTGIDTWYSWYMDLAGGTSYYVPDALNTVDKYQIDGSVCGWCSGPTCQAKFQQPWQLSSHRIRYS